MRQHRRQGLALILVMTVVMALAIIATPFVLSMILQERSATTARYLSQADYGADGAKNYAIWRLMQSVDAVERQSKGTSYYYDTQAEFDIHTDEDMLTARLNTVDPKGNITVLAQSPDCDGSDGGLDQPGEPIIWNGKLVISCFDAVTGPDKVNTKHDKPYTIAYLELKK